MTKQDHPYSKQDLDDVLDNPDWTAEKIAMAKAIDEIDPELAANIKLALRPAVKVLQNQPARHKIRKLGR